MKTILVPTDFSESAKNAALYAAHVAKAIDAKITLCHAIKVPMDAAYAAQVAWPLEDYDTLTAEADVELKQLAATLQAEVMAPHATKIDTHCGVGDVSDVVRNLLSYQKCLMTVMGMSGAGAVSRFFLGSNTEDMIGKANGPVLLIPAHAAFKAVKKIAFATDLSYGDVELIHVTASLAAYFNAEILIAHVTIDDYGKGEERVAIDNFLNEVTCKANYPAIYYRHIKNGSVNDGLKWLCDNAMVDMLVMVHRKVSSVDQLFGSSHTKKTAHYIEIPLMVLPAGMASVKF
jgi:nucleotide-binding universal stress UspA family protein